MNCALHEVLIGRAGGLVELVYFIAVFPRWSCNSYVGGLADWRSRGGAAARSATP